MLKTGLIGKEQMIVSHSNSAVSAGGTLEVFSTPAMCALMEGAASSSVQKFLEQGMTTVGVSMNIKHTSPTALGMKVYCESVLTELDGKRLVFKITAFDRTGVIGTAVHERMIVNAKSFMEKAAAKKDAKI